MKNAIASLEETVKSNVIVIERFSSVDLSFLGQGYTVAEQDEKILAINTVDLSKVLFEHTLTGNEKSLGSEGGKIRLTRLKETGLPRLDVPFFRVIFQNQSKIPVLETMSKASLLTFDGTIILDPQWRKRVLFLYWGDSKWNYNTRLLSDSFGKKHLSLLIP